MGVASFSVGAYGRIRGSGAPVVLSSVVRASGAHTTSTTASNMADGGGAITCASGEIVQIHASVAMRVRFGGVPATVATGHYIPAGIQVEFECDEPGTVSIVDVA